MMYTVRLKKVCYVFDLTLLPLSLTPQPQIAHHEELAVARERLTEHYGLGDDPDVMFGKADELYAAMRFAECYRLTAKWVLPRSCPPNTIANPSSRAQDPRGSLLPPPDTSHSPRLHASPTSSPLKIVSSRSRARRERARRRHLLVRRWPVVLRRTPVGGVASIFRVSPLFLLSLEIVLISDPSQQIRTHRLAVWARLARLCSLIRLRGRARSSHHRLLHRSSSLARLAPSSPLHRHAAPWAHERQPRGRVPLHRQGHLRRRSSRNERARSRRSARRSVGLSLRVLSRPLPLFR